MSETKIDVNLLLAAINGLISIAFTIWSSLRKVAGAEEIPSWDEIIAKNTTLQSQIDAEAGKV